MTAHPPKTATVIYVRGIPGSGKSHLARALQQSFHQGDVVMLDPDAIDFESDDYKTHVTNQVAEAVDEALWPYRFLRAKAYQAIEHGKTIIWNQPFTNLEIFHKAANRLKDHAAAHDTRLYILIVEVEVDPAIAWQRTIERKSKGGHGPSEDRFQRFVNDYRSFAGEGYPTVVVNGTEDIKNAIAKVQTAIDNLS